MLNPLALNNWVVISETSSCSVKSFAPTTMAWATAAEYSANESAGHARAAMSLDRGIRGGELLAGARSRKPIARRAALKGITSTRKRRSDVAALASRLGAGVQ